jgi:hypothetical protein
MSGEIVQFDSSVIARKLRDRIRVGLMELIPDEQWDALIKSEVEAFTKPERLDQWGRPVQPSRSSLQHMIRDELNQEAKARIKATLEDEDFKREYLDGRYVIGQAVKKIANELAPTILTGFVESIVESALSRVRNSLGGY